jgi:branched-subunit amino acid transport protein
MNEIILIAGMALVTFLIRYPMLALVGRVTLPQPIIRALHYVPVAVLTAIIIPTMIMPQNEVDFTPGNAYLVAGIFSAVIAWRTKNLLLTIGLGMAFFLLWRAVVGV